jgi:2-polyprenyl-3-methyl-5-hydroxy-6-metoxy-1,4-benzoquinol methylase
MLQENIYGHRKKLEFILAAIRKYSESNAKPLSEINILDFGCGNGTAISYEIAALGVQLTGVDFHTESIAYAKAHNQYTNARFISGDENKVVERGELFDVIVYSDVVEHLPEPRSTLKRLETVHKEGGILVGAIPNGYGPFEIEKLFSRWLGIEWFAGRTLRLASKIKRKIAKRALPKKTDQIPYNLECTHCQFFKLKDLHRLINEIGCKPLQFRNGAFLGAPVSALFLSSPWFINWNVKVADKLPPYLVSTWYFLCEKPR